MWFIKNIFSYFKKPFVTLNNIYISKKAILNNIEIFEKLYPNYHIFPVLKSNAYWHWIKEIATILRDKNIEKIVVDSYFEALEVQKVNSSEILIIWYILPENFKNINFKKISLTIYDMDNLKELSKLNKKVNIHLKLDTWMHRQWIYIEDLPEFLEFIKQNKNINLEWVCTHLADADNIENDYSLNQQKLFKTWIDIIKKYWFNPKYIHLSNSAWSSKLFWKDFCNSLRLWISLYWVNPLEENDENYKTLKDLNLALSFYSTLILKKELKSWEKVSYNWTFTSKKDITIWIIPVWYYEWLSRKLSNNYEFYFWDYPLKILGRVCMNLTIIDITWVNINVWDRIEIISNSKTKNNNIYSQAKRSETIPYECLTRLSETIRRDII